MKPNWISRAMGVVCLSIIAACFDPNAEIVARMKHDFNGGSEFFSYPAKPSDRIGQAEAIAKKQYGSLLSNVKSPATMFMCLWRNPSFAKFTETRPSEIF